MADKAPWTQRAWDFWVTQAHAAAKDLHNNIVPAFPTYAQGVDEPGTPLNPYGPKQSFEEKVAKVVSTSPATGKEQDKGMEQ
jgi:hypothetical protein